MKITPPPKCPVCGEEALPKMTTWGLRHEHCGLWSWNGGPLVDEATHAARKYAHECFDRLWQSRKMTRTEAYRRLGEEIGLPPGECHIAKMDKRMAERAAEAAISMLKRIMLSYP